MPVDRPKQYRIQFMGRNTILPVYMYLQGGIQQFKKTLLRERRDRDNGHIIERLYSIPYLALCVPYRIRLFLDQIPFIEPDHETLLQTLSQFEYADILRFDLTGGIDQKNGYIARLDGSFGTQRGVKFYVFGNISTFSQAGGIYEDNFFLVLRQRRVD